MLRLSLFSLLCAAAVACEFPRKEGDVAIEIDGGPSDGPRAVLEAPRLVAPMANSYTGAFIPQGELTRFSWRDDSSLATSFVLQIAAATDFVVGLQSFTTTVPQRDIALQPLFGNSGVPVGRRIYWRVQACASGRCTAFTKARALNFGRSSHDFNGDGLSDIAIGAALASPGKVSVFFGGSNGPDQTVDGALVSALAGDFFGKSLAAAGDINSDGFADLLVGAPGEPGATIDDCSVQLYLGGSGTTMNTVADFSLSSVAPVEIGYAVSSAGDFNGDGHDDFLVGSPGATASNGQVMLFLGGGPLTTAAATFNGSNQERAGIAVASAGDFNGDGFSDVLVGTGRNKVYLFLGSSTPTLSTPITLTSGSSPESFGLSLSAGDVNGDGFSDILAGASTNGDSLPGAGRAYIFIGRAHPTASISAPTFKLTGGGASSRFGTSVSASGDLNRDGFADVVVGAATSQDSGANSNTGSFYVYFGGNSFDTTFDARIIGGTNEFLGAAVSVTGDTNGDRFDDLLVGTNSTAQPLGRSYLYRGGAPFDPSADNIYTGTVNNTGFGTSIARATMPPSFFQCSPKRS